MRSPLPRQKLVAITLTGAVLTAIVAVGLAAPTLLSGSSNSIDSVSNGVHAVVTTVTSTVGSSDNTPAGASSAGDDPGAPPADQGHDWGEHDDHGRGDD